MSVGVPEIDADHRVLVSLINQVREAGEGFEATAVTGSVLNALVDYTNYHFAREERMREAIGHPRLVEHKTRHETMRAQVLDYLERYLADPQAVDVADLAGFLEDWLVTHIMKEDMAYRPLAEGSAEARKAAASLGVEAALREMGAEGGRRNDGAPMSLERLRVLVIDDNANMRRLIQTILASVQVGRVVEADGSAAALDIMRRGEEFDLILVDYLMQQANGLDFVRTVRREFGRDKMSLPIIIITGYAELVKAEEAKRAGANDFIAKPFTPRTLVQRIARIISTLREAEKAGLRRA